MRAFDLDRSLIDSYESFSRSFTTIRATDLSEALNRHYADGRFWPDALLSINPHYEVGDPADALAAAQRDSMRDPNWSHPYYWAAYGLTGDGGSSPDE